MPATRTIPARPTPRLASKAKALFDAAPAQTGNATQAVVSAAGDISVGTTSADRATTFAAFDATTKHNVPKAFADYRATAGLPTIGYALSEPFFATVKIAGTQRQVMVQVFERRVLTYTATNPAAFQVEMGNVGQHYYQWRYGSSRRARSRRESDAIARRRDGDPDVELVRLWDQHERITAIHAAWIVPAATAPPATGYAATWVGIGGQDDERPASRRARSRISRTVCRPTMRGSRRCLMIPSVSRRAACPPAPATSSAVTITNTGGDNWSIMLENRTTSQHLSLTVTYQSCKCSAEWIEEVPDLADVSDPALANFGTVSFTEATATVGGVVHPATDLHPEPLALNQGGKVVAQPHIAPDGTSLVVAYVP